DQDRIPHTGLDGKDRRDHNPREPSEHGAEAEHDHKKAAYVDAESGHHPRIARTGPDEHPDPGMLHQDMNSDGGRKSRPNDNETPYRIKQAARQDDRSSKQLRNRKGEGFCAPNGLDPIVEEQNYAKGRHDLVEVIPAIKVTEHQKFKQKPAGQRRCQREHKGGQKIARQGVEHDCEISAKHILDAVSKVDEIHHAKDERQPGSDKEEENAHLQSIEELDQKEGARHRNSSVMGMKSRNGYHLKGQSFA